MDDAKAPVGTYGAAQCRGLAAVDLAEHSAVLGAKDELSQSAGTRITARPGGSMRGRCFVTHGVHIVRDILRKRRSSQQFQNTCRRLAVFELISTAPGVGVQEEERARFQRQVAQYAHENDMLEHVAHVAGMIGMSILQMRWSQPDRQPRISTDADRSAARDREESVVSRTKHDDQLMTGHRTNVPRPTDATRSWAATGCSARGTDRGITAQGRLLRRRFARAARGPRLGARLEVRFLLR